ncbi:MAG: preprotein translocase subunit SecY [Clostridia bacterium]|nr:preprotein translocase subunit SecY [Clostridia bacterium]
MFKTLKNAWKVPELRNKLLFTLLIIILFRLGSAIPVPYFEYGSTLAEMEAFSTGILGFLSMLSGGALAQGTLLALGVQPYITASIVMQLLTIAIPPLERLSKQGEEGKKKINLYTRLITVVLAIITGIGYTMFVINTEGGEFFHETDAPVWFAAMIMVFCYCAGAMLVMWLAEKINDHGIGNGISIILFAGIVAGFTQNAQQLYAATFTSNNGEFNYVGLIMAIITIIAILAILMMIVWMSDAERRIPIQYAKRVVGRKMYGGQNTNLPIKVNMSGVMPIIFANSIVAVPLTIASFMNSANPNWFTKLISGEWVFLSEMAENRPGVSATLQSILSFNQNSIPYFIIFFVLLIAFAYFYVAISFNPVEVANNIKNNGGAIPGIRSGRPTVDFIKKVLGRVTLVGALLVAIIACAPMLASLVTTIFAKTFEGSLFSMAAVNMSFIAFGGSSLMIVVGVALETARELEAQMSLRNYKGFLD